MSARATLHKSATFNDLTFMTCIAVAFGRGRKRQSGISDGVQSPCESD